MICELANFLFLDEEAGYDARTYDNVWVGD